VDRLESPDDALCVAGLSVRLCELDGDRVAAERTLELLGRALGDDPAARDDREAVGQAVRLLEVVRRQEDGQRLVRGEPSELGPHRGSSLGIETRGRLVQVEHARPVDEAEAYVEPALHAARVRADDASSGLGEPEDLEELVDTLVEGGAAHALDVPLQREVLAARSLPVDARLLRHVADRGADAVGLAYDVAARHRCAPAVRGGESREDPHGRRLPGAVRPEQPEDLPLADLEGRAVERADVLAVGLLEPFDGDHRHGGESSQGVLNPCLARVARRWTSTSTRARSSSSASGSPCRTAVSRSRPRRRERPQRRSEGRSSSRRRSSPEAAERRAA